MYQNFMPLFDPMYIPYTRCENPVARDLNLKLTRAYIPRQPYTALFPLTEGLSKGTMFPNLYTPYPAKKDY